MAIPDTEDPYLQRLEETTPRDGFAGILSRSRFTSPDRPTIVGHGGAQTFIPSGSDEYDPAAGKSQFRRGLPNPGTFDEDRSSDLGASQGALVRDGLLRFFRRRVDTTLAGFKAQDPNIMGWGVAPFPRAIRQPRFTLRSEFEQGAQSFSGLHTLIIKGARASTFPQQMGPPRTNRLTRRAAPGSFGQETKVMNGRS